MLGLAIIFRDKNQVYSNQKVYLKLKFGILGVGPRFILEV